MNPVVIVVLILCGSVFTALGIHAGNRKSPMWFYSGTGVKEEEITDIPAYNRANQWMWFGYAAVFWISLLLGFWNAKAGIFLLMFGSVGGGLALPLIYHRIYDRYRRRPPVSQ